MLTIDQRKAVLQKRADRFSAAHDIETAREFQRRLSEIRCKPTVLEELHDEQIEKRVRSSTKPSKSEESLTQFAERLWARRRGEFIQEIHADSKPSK